MLHRLPEFAETHGGAGCDVTHHSTGSDVTRMDERGLQVIINILENTCRLCLLGLTLTTLNYFCINHGEQRVFSVLNDHKCFI